MAKKTKKLAFGGLAGAAGNAFKGAGNAIQARAAANPGMAAPAGAPVGGGAPMPGGIQGAINSIKANAAKYPGMAAPAGAPVGGGAAMLRPSIMRRMKMNEGGKVSSASKRADGCAVRGKTRA